MIQWEYQITAIESNREGLIGALNELGQQGWEVYWVQVINQTVKDSLRFYCKRQVDKK